MTTVAGGQSGIQNTAKMLTWPLKSPQMMAGPEEGKGKRMLVSQVPVKQVVLESVDDSKRRGKGQYS